MRTVRVPQLELLQYGHLVGQARQTSESYLGGLADGKQPEAITLRAGQTASALYEATAQPENTHPCPTYNAVRVTPPGSTHSVQLAVPDALYLCDTQVHPLEPTGPDPGPRHSDDDGPLWAEYGKHNGR